jgi:hypothetical protein
MPTYQIPAVVPAQVIYQANGRVLWFTFAASICC